MYKRLMKQSSYLDFRNKYPRFTLGTFVITLLCSFFLVISTFSQLYVGQIVIPDGAFVSFFDFLRQSHNWNEFIKLFYYIPQIPAVLFIGALLGPRASVLAITIYVIAGLIGFPVFALGGGIKYFSQLGFGYIIGYFVGAYITGRILQKNITNFSLLKATVLGVLAIHLFGIIYLSILMFFRGEQLFLILNWIWLLSGIQIIYDLLIGFMAVGLARPVKSLLWLVMR